MDRCFYLTHGAHVTAVDTHVVARSIESIFFANVVTAAVVAIRRQLFFQALHSGVVFEAIHLVAAA